MIIRTPDQRTEAWRQARCGQLTSSRVADMLRTTQAGRPAKARVQLRTALVLERLTGQPHERIFVSAAMQYGWAREADARAAYEAATGLVVVPTGFVAHDTLAAGCSPDGEVDGFTGVVELKCCSSATHLEFLETSCVPRDHLIQLTHQIWVTGAQWGDYVSFDDRFPASLQLAIVRVARAELDLRLYELNVRAFLAEVDQALAALQGLADDADAGVA